MGKIVKTRLMIAYTRKCTAACRHCCAEASPGRREKNLADQVIPLVAAFVQSGGRTILFTGGEAMIHMDELEAICGAIKHKDTMIKVFTNAFWADSPKNARTMASRMKDMGIRQANLSTSKFHQEFIPFDNIRHAADAFKSTGVKMNILLYHDRKPGIANAATLFNVSRLKVPFSVNYCNVEGRAKSLNDDTVFRYHDTGEILTRPCNQSDMLYINWLGDAWSCCAASFKNMTSPDFFRLGRLETDDLKLMNERLNAYNPVLGVLYGKGPGAVFKCLKDPLEKRGFVLKDRYASQCDLCCDLFGHSAFRDLIMAHFKIDMNKGNLGHS
jgi:hypothetical protein